MRKASHISHYTIYNISVFCESFTLVQYTYTVPRTLHYHCLNFQSFYRYGTQKIKMSLSFKFTLTLPLIYDGLRLNFNSL